MLLPLLLLLLLVIVFAAAVVVVAVATVVVSYCFLLRLLLPLLLFLIIVFPASIENNPLRAPKRSILMIIVCAVDVGGCVAVVDVVDVVDDVVVACGVVDVVAATVSAAKRYPLGQPNKTNSTRTSNPPPAIRKHVADSNQNIAAVGVTVVDGLFTSNIKLVETTCFCFMAGGGYQCHLEKHGC